MKRLKQEEEEEENSKRFLFLKSIFSKRPWYTGGKVVFSQDGETIYCLNQQGVGILNKNNLTIVANGDEVVSFALAAGPGILATCSRRGLIRIFDNSLKETRSFNSLHSGPVSEMDFDPTGELIATGSADRTVKVFSASRGYVTHNFKGHESVISCVKFHPNEGNLSLATADVGGVVCVWDLRTKKSTWLKSHLSSVTSVSFLNQTLLVSVGRDRVLNVWSKDDTIPLKTVPVFESLEAVIAIDSTHFITGGAEGVLKKWKFDSKVNECIQVETIKENTDGINQLLLFKNVQPNSMEKLTLVSVSQLECLFSFRSVKTLEKHLQGQLIGFDDQIFDVCFLGNNKNQVLVATNSSLIRIYSFDLDNNNEGKQEVKLLSGHESSILSVASNSNYFITGSKDQSAILWNLSTFEMIGKCSGHTDSVGTVAAGNKSNIFLTGSDDCSIRLWNNEIECLDQKVAHTKSVLDVCFSPNDELVASASADKTCKIWKIENFKLKGPISELRGHRRAVNSVCFSTVDRVVCTSSADTSIKVWSINTGTCVRTLQGHTSPTTCAMFMRNGTSLISSASDGTIKTWDLKSSTCGQTLLGSKDGGHEDRIWSLALLQEEENSFVASVGVDGVITIWKDATEEEKEKRLSIQKEELLNKEALERSLREKRYLDAAKLALRLNRPHQLRLVLEIVPPDEINEFVHTLLKDSDSAQISSFLNAITSWNTIGRTSLVAQRSLVACLAVPNIETLVKPQVFSKFIKATAPYTDRHFTRIDKLLKSSYVLDRVLETTSTI